LSAAGARLRPARLCRELLEALAASDGRRKRRHRDTTPDAIGMQIKRVLLESAVREDPDPERFEEWLMLQCLAAPAAESVGAYRAMALDIVSEWRLADSSPDFRRWLDRGAPSDDAATGGDGSGHARG
jgi:hypothetical protein